MEMTKDLGFLCIFICKNWKLTDAQSINLSIIKHLHRIQVGSLPQVVLDVVDDDPLDRSVVDLLEAIGSQVDHETSAELSL